jgi:hypothetical protein
MSPNWTTLLATFALALLLIGLGRLLDRCLWGGRSAESSAMAWLIFGWGLVSLTGALCALCGLTVLVPAVWLCMLGIVGYLIDLPLLPVACLMLGCLTVAPLLLIASAIPPMMYDEFAQWLPNTRFLVDYGRFPDLTNPNIWSAKAAYPPAIPVLGYGVYILIGSGWEFAAKIFTVIVAVSFGLILAQVIRERVGNIFALSIGVSCSTVLNPFFDPRISLTAYADAPTGFILAFLVYACWLVVEEQDLRRVGLPIFAGMLLILLRETNVVLVAGVAAALALIGRRGRFLSIALVSTSLAAFLLWRSYIVYAGIPPAILPRALSDWRWDAPWLVLESLITERLADHVAIGGGILLLSGFAIGILISRWQVFRPTRHLLLICSIVSLLWTSFLLWAYIAVFSPEEVVRAAAAWRYLAQLGPMFLLVCFAMAATTMPVKVPSVGAGVATTDVFAFATLLMPGLLIMGTRSHWQIDLQYPLKRRIHSVAEIIAPIIGAKPLTVVHPLDASEVALEIDYDLHRPLGSSVPSSRLDDQQGLVLNVTGFEGTACAHLLLRADSKRDDVTPTDLLAYCRRLNLASD